MQSHTTEAFRRLLAAAPAAIRAKAEHAYRLWASNPSHPSLGVLKESTMVWFWVGPHDEYEKLLDKL